MAFDRFVRRYASALSDSAFIDELGPIPATTNAVIFGHRLSRLLERDGVSPRWATGAQIATWRFLWGSDDLPAVTEHLDDETAEAVRRVLSDAGARATTLRGLVAALDHAVESETEAALRDTARHLLTDTGFGLDAALLSEAAGGHAMASGFLSALSQMAEPISAGEIVEYVLAPIGIPRSSAEWRTEKIRRAGRIPGYQATTFVIRAPVEGLSARLAHEILERVAVAAHFARQDTTYVRACFEGNGKAVAYWDENAKSGLVMINDQIEDLDSLNLPWPYWRVQVDWLGSQLGGLGTAELSA